MTTFLLSFVGSFCRFWHYWPRNQVLLSRLNSVFGIPMVSVIPLRQISVHFTVNKWSSLSPSEFMYGVPQGSVLGPILFVLYTTPLSDIIANHSVNHQLFANDTQLQKSAPLSEVTNLTKELSACTDDSTNDGKPAQTERRHSHHASLWGRGGGGGGGWASLSPFVFLETFYSFPPWFDYSWLSQHPLLWFR